MILGIGDSFVISYHTCRQVLYNFSSCAKSAWILTASVTGESGKRELGRIWRKWARGDVGNAVSFPAATWLPFPSSKGYLSDTFIMCHVKLSSVDSNSSKSGCRLKTRAGRLMGGRPTNLCIHAAKFWHHFTYLMEMCANCRCHLLEILSAALCLTFFNNAVLKCRLQ